MSYSISRLRNNYESIDVEEAYNRDEVDSLWNDVEEKMQEDEEEIEKLKNEVEKLKEELEEERKNNIIANMSGEDATKHLAGKMLSRDGKPVKADVVLNSLEGWDIQIRTVVTFTHPVLLQSVAYSIGGDC